MCANNVVRIKSEVKTFSLEMWQTSSPAADAKTCVHSNNMLIGKLSSSDGVTGFLLSKKVVDDE